MTDINQNIMNQITQIQEQVQNMNNYLNNFLVYTVRTLPLIFIGIMMFIKNKYGDKKIVKRLLTIIFIFLILYLCFALISTGCINSAIQSSTFQGLIIAGVGGMSIDSNTLKLNDTITDLLNYITA